MPTNDRPLDSVRDVSLTHELSRENRADSLVVTELRRQVANALVLYANYKHYYWQTYGPLFRDMHKRFDRLAKDVLRTLDELAARVRMIGQDPPAHLLEASDPASVYAATPHSTVREMVEEAHRHHSGPSTHGRSLIKRPLVLGLGLLVLGYGAGCGGSQPADTAAQTPEAGTSSGAPTVQEGAQIAQDLGASSITGTVTFDGKVPALRPLGMEAEPVCHEMHSGKPVPNEMLVLGSGNTMGNIMVWVSKGLPAGETWPAPQTPVVLDQKGCQYVPHVMGIMVGQTYRILNSDGILHNIHTLPEINPSLNRGQPATVKEMTTSFPKPEGMFQIKCDVHPWMSAYIGVFTHPFYSVTGTDGKYTISGLAPGTYEITAWHERLGTQTASTTVGANDTKAQNFKFTTT